MGAVLRDGTIEAASELRSWRTRVLNVLLTVGAIVAIPAIALFLIYAIPRPEEWPFLSIYLAIYLLIAGMAFLRRLDIRVRAWVAVLSIYVVGVQEFARGGLAGDGRLFLLALPILTLILVGARAGLTMAGLSLLTYAFFTLAAHLGWLKNWLAQRENPVLLMDWLGGGAVFALVLIVSMVLEWFFNRFQMRTLWEARRTAAELAQSQRLMSSVFASIASGVIAVDGEGQITLMNRSAEYILHSPAEQALGKSFQEVFPSLWFHLEPLVAYVRRGHRPTGAREVELELPERGMAHLWVVVSALRETEQKQGGVTIVLEDLTEQRRLEAQERLIRETFQRYVSPVVVRRLLEDAAIVQLGGRRQEVTVLFADLRGFTSFSERLTPEELVEVLNGYLTIGAEAVLKEEGTLDKFIGDALMAIFNAPLPQPDHTLRAIRAALQIRQAVQEHHRKVPSGRLHYGIGIAVGEAVVGNIGTAQQLNYTAIGTCVNLAKRLEERAVEGQILLTEEAYERVKEQVQARPLASIAMAGMREPVRVYEVKGLLSG